MVSPGTKRSRYSHKRGFRIALLAQLVRAIGISIGRRFDSCTGTTENGGNSIGFDSRRAIA